MAAYDKIPEERPYPTKKGAKKSAQRSQRPGHPADEPRGLAEMPKGLTPKKAAPASKRQREAESKALDKTNKPTKVAGKSGTRDSLAPGARKASTPTPKPKETDKKVRGQSKK